MCIVENDWEKADDVLENILNSSPKNSVAYLGKLMVELKFNGKNIEVLPADIEIMQHKYLRMAKNYLPYSSEYKNIINSHIDNLYYSISLRYAQEGEKSDSKHFLDCYLNAIKACELAINHPLSKSKIDEYKSIIYEKADKYSESRQIEDVKLAVSYFKEIITYRDSELRIQRHNDEIEQYSKNIAEIEKAEKYNNAVKFYNNKDYHSAKEILEGLDGYREAKELLVKSKLYADKKEKKDNIKTFCFRPLCVLLLIVSIVMMFFGDNLFFIDSIYIKIIISALCVGCSFGLYAYNCLDGNILMDLIAIITILIVIIMVIVSFVIGGILLGCVFIIVAVASWALTVVLTSDR